MSRVLLTGIPGWLGNHFLEVLARGFDGGGPVNDWQIRCLVFENADGDFLRERFNTPSIEWVAGDVTKKDSLKAALKDVAIVFHLVGIIHPPRVSEFYRINTEGTENMLRASVECGVRKFIYVSSNSAAGTNLRRDRLLDENEEPRPYLNYGLSKYRAECSVKDYQRAGELNTVILRPCWYYGPNQPRRQTTFFKMIKKGNPLIFGDGEELRSMTYLDNLCQAMLLAAERDSANGQIYWIADARPYSVNEIYSTLAELLEVKSFQPRYVPDFVSEGCVFLDKLLQKLGFYVKEIHVAGEMNKSIACSIEKAKRELGYDPPIDLREGMRRSIEWCRNNGIEI